MSDVITTADDFHHMRGHVAEGTTIIFHDGTRGRLTGTLREWIVFDDATGRQMVRVSLNADLLVRAVHSLNQTMKLQ